MDREQINPSHKKSCCFPTNQQELLLKAALLHGDKAVSAWEAWKSSVDIDNIDPGSYRLLPMLYHRATVLRVTDPHIRLYKGTYKMAWYKNRLLFHAIAHLLKSLHAARIETMILKGAALCVQYYKDVGLRPMNDFDILVPTGAADAAINVLIQSGWNPLDFMPTPQYVSVRYSHGFGNSTGSECDLHWHLLPDSFQADADRDFWEGAVMTKINDVATHALNPADQLLHILAHGMKWDPVPPIRWVTDAMMVISTAADTIDWSRLIVQAHKHRIAIPLKDTLIYLKDTFDAPIPSGVLQRIEGLPVSRMERFEYRTSGRPPTVITDILSIWFQHSRLNENRGVVYRLMTLPYFLKGIWSVDRVWKIPLYGIYKMLTWSRMKRQKKPSQKAA